MRYNPLEINVFGSDDERAIVEGYPVEAGNANSMIVPPHPSLDFLWPIYPNFIP
jgi:hypothetical protein